MKKKTGFLFLIILSNLTNEYLSSAFSSTNVAQSEIVKVFINSNSSSSLDDPVHRRSLSETNQSMILCPIDRADTVGVYQVPPNGTKLSEVSYMAHSSQIYEGTAKVVW